EQFVLEELSLAAVLQPEDAPAIIAELRHDQVDLAVAIQIAGLHIGDPAKVIADDVCLEPLTPAVLQPDDLAAAAVGGPDAAEHGDDDVQITIAIQIDHGSMARGGQVAVAQDMFFPLAAWGLAIPDDPVAHRVTGDDIGDAVAVEIGNLHIGDERPIA